MWVNEIYISHSNVSNVRMNVIFTSFYMFPKWFLFLYFICVKSLLVLIQGLLPIGIQAVKKTHKIDKTLLFNRKCVVFIH